MTFPNASNAPFSVNLWGSHPDEGNDDNHSGSDHDTLEDAERAFAEPVNPRWAYFIAFVVLTGPDGLQRVRPNPTYDAKRVARESARDDAESRSEQAMQAGMAFGVAGYNDAMGFDVEPGDREPYDRE